jgi:hypothetical protein
MATTAATWFYRAPEQRRYYIAERVNGTFWDARLAGVMLNVVRAEPPFLMTGTYAGTCVQMEWVPNQWLRLSTQPEAPGLQVGVANILRRKPAIRYETEAGETVWEWWVGSVDARWQELQGKPAYRHPLRLDGAG